MATPYEAFQNSFHSRMTSKYVIFPELEEQYFLNALGDFELQLYALTFTKTEVEQEEPFEEPVYVSQIEENLSRSEIGLLGALMYKHYLSHKIDEVLQLQNIVGKDIALTGIGQSKQEYNRKYEVLQKEVKELFNGLKENTYQD